MNRSLFTRCFACYWAKPCGWGLKTDILETLIHKQNFGFSTKDGNHCDVCYWFLKSRVEGVEANEEENNRMDESWADDDEGPQTRPVKMSVGMFGPRLVYWDLISGFVDSLRTKSMWRSKTSVLVLTQRTVDQNPRWNWKNELENHESRSCWKPGGQGCLDLDQ